MKLRAEMLSMQRQLSEAKVGSRVYIFSAIPQPCIILISFLNTVIPSFVCKSSKDDRSNRNILGRITVQTPSLRRRTKTSLLRPSWLRRIMRRLDPIPPKRSSRDENGIKRRRGVFAVLNFVLSWIQNALCNGVMVSALGFANHQSVSVNL